MLPLGLARGEAPLGIVYSTDAAAEPGVKIVATFPADSHPPITYPAALARESKNADASSFLYAWALAERLVAVKAGWSPGTATRLGPVG